MAFEDHKYKENEIRREGMNENEYLYKRYSFSFKPIFYIVNKSKIE